MAYFMVVLHSTEVLEEHKTVRITSSPSKIQTNYYFGTSLGHY
jgi:hypothetical protein